MNYQKIHDAIIANAKIRTTDEYTEKHHIIPRCMSGTNDKINLVRLLAREHFLIHWMLVKIYPENNKLKFAFHLMTVRDKNQKRYTSKSYKYARKLHAKAISVTLKGVSNPNKARIPWNKGKIGVYSEDTLKRISTTLTGSIPWNKGIPQTEEQKIANSKSHLGQIAWNKGLKTGKLSLERVQKREETKKLNRLKRLELNANYSESI